MPPINRPQTAPRRADIRIESPTHLAVAGAGLWLVAVLLHPLSVLAPVGILLLIVAGIAYLIRPRNRTMYWRDRQIELTDDSPTFAHQLYRAVFKH